MILHVGIKIYSNKKALRVNGSVEGCFFGGVVICVAKEKS